MVTYIQPGRYNWMYQFYLRAEGLALSWVGTGRFIFPHNLPDEDYEQIKVRIVNAARRMQKDGWWWLAPGMDNKTIKRLFMKELISKRLGILATSRLDTDANKHRGPGSQGTANELGTN
jgi:glutamate-1-semialdehyde 2,1-aminomutase